MTPAPYLSKLAREYFDHLVSILEERGDANDGFSMELSQLAHEFSKYHEGVDDQNTYGKYQEAKTGWKSEGPWMNVQVKARSVIDKLSPKFGLTPSDYEKLKGKVAPTTEAKSPLEKMIAGD